MIIKYFNKLIALILVFSMSINYVYIDVRANENEIELTDVLTYEDIEELLESIYDEELNEETSKNTLNKIESEINEDAMYNIYGEDVTDEFLTYLNIDIVIGGNVSAVNGKFNKQIKTL